MGRAGQWSEARSPGAGPRPSGRGFHSLRKEKSQPGLSLRWGPGAPTCFPPQGGGDKGKAGMLGDRGRPSCHVTHTPCGLEGNKPVGVGARYEPDSREKPGKMQKRTQHAQGGRLVRSQQAVTSSAQAVVGVAQAAGVPLTVRNPLYRRAGTLGTSGTGLEADWGTNSRFPEPQGTGGSSGVTGGFLGSGKGPRCPCWRVLRFARCGVRGVEGRAHGQRSLRRWARAGQCPCDPGKCRQAGSPCSVLAQVHPCWLAWGLGPGAKGVRGPGGRVHCWRAGTAA